MTPDQLAARLLPLLGGRPDPSSLESYHLATSAEALARVLAALAVLSDRRQGVAPSQREIAAEARLQSPSTVRHHVRRLAELQLVKPSDIPGQARSLVLTDKGRALTTTSEENAA